MTDKQLSEVPFQAHVELLNMFLRHRDEIVDRINAILNAQRRPLQYLQDGPLLSRHFEDCFFSSTSIDPGATRLRGQLQDVHWTSGFRPRVMPGMHNDLVDPAQMMVRGFHLWQQTRWPGRNGRMQYAHTLFNVYLMRCLELLSMRLWDAGPGDAGGRLAHIQRVLDELWRTTPDSQPVLVRDAHWLIPLAQSPTTDDLSPYFDVVERVSESLRGAERIEVFKAAVVMAGGHLRSQLRHHCMKHGVSFDDQNLILTSRNSNALDFAVLVQGLVELLDRYEEVLQTGDIHDRCQVANAICQGISVDPDLFVNRIDLLGAYSMIENLFSTTNSDGAVLYTPKGRRHVEILRKYQEQINRVTKPLHEDCIHFKPAAGGYSPYGLMYGFSSNLTEHVVLKSLQPDAVTNFSLEDAFTDGSSDKLAWVTGWRKLPHVDQQMQRRFGYPQEFAEDVFDRMERALREAAQDGGTSAVNRAGRLFVVSDDDARSASSGSFIPDLPVHYMQSSDSHWVSANKARFCEQAQLIRDRLEGMFMVSYETPGGWAALSKDILTDVLGAGRDAKIAGLPHAARQRLELMYPDLIVVELKECR